MRRWALALPVRLAAAVAVGALLFAVVVLGSVVDLGELGAGLSNGASDPVGLALIALALLAAFSMRAKAWCHVLAGLGFGQSLAAIHLALGANHVLPFRLGEPMRVLSVVRRTDVATNTATSSTVLLRTADIVTLVLLGALAGPGLISGQLGRWGALALAAVAATGIVATIVIIGQRSRQEPGETPAVRLPAPHVLGLVLGAWLCEAIVVWRVALWFDVNLTAQQAIVVLATAVSVQLVAITPGGVGTYEAAATAALVAADVPATTAVTLAVVVHAVKTLYSIVAGVVAVVFPRPSLLGRLRLSKRRPAVAPTPAGDGPIVLFLPAHNEEPRVAAVVEAAPATIDGRPVEVVVVDDGSTDETAMVAAAAGATVISHETNAGLGAAVRTGLRHGVDRQASAVAFCDADGEYNAADLADLVRPVLAGDAHYVVGTRFGGTIEHMRPHRRVGNLVLTRWVRFITRAPITDGQSGYRAFSGRAAAAGELAHDYNYAQVLSIDLIAKGFGYHEVPITYTFRSTGRSFVRLGTYLHKVVPTVWRQLNPGKTATVDPTFRRTPTHVPAKQ